MFNNYIHNIGYFGSPNEMLNQALRLQTAQEYYKKLMLGNNFGSEKSQKSLVEVKENQKMLIIRHGERMDTYYGPSWIPNSFNRNGEYVRKDSNMPQNLIYRENPYEFEFDPPLTENGLNQAKIHGEELAKTGVKIKHVYSSPALRSIQTADKILEGMGLKDKIKIRIEVGLFELMSWQLYIPSSYPWIDKLNLKNFGYNIDMNFKSMVNFESLKKDESIYDYYKRSHYVTKKISELHEDGNMMLVGHAPSLEGCSRLLTGEPMRSTEEFAAIIRKIPFLSIAQCEKNTQNGTWRLTPLLSSYEKFQKALNSGNTRRQIQKSQK